MIAFGYIRDLCAKCSRLVQWSYKRDMPTRTTMPSTTKGKGPTDSYRAERRPTTRSRKTESGHWCRPTATFNVLTKRIVTFTRNCRDRLVELTRESNPKSRQPPLCDRLHASPSAGELLPHVRIFNADESKNNHRRLFLLLLALTKSPPTCSSWQRYSDLQLCAAAYACLPILGRFARQ